MGTASSGQLEENNEEKHETNTISILPFQTAFLEFLWPKASLSYSLSYEGACYHLGYCPPLRVPLATPPVTK